MTTSTDNPELDKKIIIENFMEELCRTDDENNKGLSIDSRGDRIVFSVEEIRQKHLRTSSIGGYANNILPYALAEEINNNNQSLSISILNKKGLDLLSSARIPLQNRYHFGLPWTHIISSLIFNSIDRSVFQPHSF
jgi:hypothetical protein